MRISDWSSDVCSSDLVRRDGGGEEVLQLEDATGCHDELVAGDPADGALVHADGVGDVAQHQRPQVLDTVVEEARLLPDALGRDLQDGGGALVQRPAPARKSGMSGRSV